MDQINLVRAKKADIDILFKLENKSFNVPYSKEQLYNDLNNTEQIYIYFAYINKTLVGYIYFSKVFDELELLRIAILSKYRGKGFAYLVLSNAIKLFKDVKFVFLEVAKNNTKAISLYLRYGFRQIGIRKRYYVDGDDALVFHYECK